MNISPCSTVLETQSLTKKYGRLIVVEQLSLLVERGEIFGFLGRNGAGKSTTIRMVLGLVRPTGGRVRLLGYDMSKHRVRALARVGAIIDSPAFYDNLSGWQNLKIFAAMSGGATRQRIAAVLESVDLRERAGDPVRVYSHGMRQRLGIAQALLPDPEFIILDEPTDGLDPQGISEMRSLIRRLVDESGLTVMLSSHLLHEVEQLCDRIAIIDSGRLLYQGSLDHLIGKDQVVRLTVDRLEEAYQLLSSNPLLSLSRNGNQSLYVRTSPEQIPRINALLVGRGIRVLELSPQRETLEHVFLRLTQNHRPPHPAGIVNLTS
jgi:ABC-2 type transport system ATP-binding protein